jgi:hypothetical protein
MRILVRHRKSQPQLIRRTLPPALAPQSARATLFQSLYYLRRISFLRFTDQQMHVLGHHHKTNQRKLISFPDISQHLHKQISRPHSPQQSLDAITTKRNEVQMSVPVNPHQFISHVSKPEEPHPYKPKGAAPTTNPNAITTQ